MSIQAYPVWWDTTLTIFNKYEDPVTQVVTWFKHVVVECFWKPTGNKVVINNVTIETDDIICRIKKNDAFLEKYVWITKPNDQMANYFTLSPGDIIVKGEVDDVINEYTSGKRSSDLLKKYRTLQGCMTIEEVGINIGEGRCNEHYFVKGI